MALSLVTAPTVEPMTTAEAKTHLRVDISTDDTFIDTLVVAVRQGVEAWVKRALCTQTYDLKLDGFPDPIWLPLPPLQSVTSVSYLDTAGVSQTWATTEYTVDAPAGPFAEPGRIALAYSKSHPSTRDQINNVTIRFVAGYGAAAAVPAGIKAAMKLWIGHLYEHRESVHIGGGRDVIMDVPQTVEALLAPFNAMRFQAVA